MRLVKEFTPGISSYEIISPCIWSVSLVRMLSILLSFYTYFAKHTNLYLSIAIAGCSLLLRSHRSEDVLIVDGLGVQTSQFGLVRNITDHKVFFPKNVIRACVINEIFEGYSVNYVIQIIKKDSDDVSPLFPKMRPGLAELHEIWSKLNKM